MIFLAVVTTTEPLTDNNAVNNLTQAAGTVKVKHVTLVFPLGYGDVITFKSTLDTVGIQVGTFKTNTGGVGTYTYTVGTPPLQPSSVSLTFTGKNPSVFAFDLAFMGMAFKFGGHKVTFNFDPTGALGSFSGAGHDDDGVFSLSRGLQMTLSQTWARQHS